MFKSGYSLGMLVLTAAATAAADTMAAGAGQVQHLSGMLSVHRPDGSVRILSQKSEVHPGDVLTTQRDSYAQIAMTDGSSMTLRPNTQVKIDAYQFVQDEPQNDSAFFRLVKGGLRTVTGLVGKRGNQDAYRIGTSTATIGIRGSSGDTLECSEGCDGVTSTSDRIERGVYHTTYTGSYIMRNESGSQIIGEGQFGFVKSSTSVPEILPNDPNLNLKQLPFRVGATGQVVRGQEDCVVK